MDQAGKIGTVPFGGSPLMREVKPMYIYLKKKAQSTAEYVIILGLIVGAVVAMQTYIKRGMQGRIRDTVDHTEDAGGLNFTGEQYEPYYLSSSFSSDSRTNKRETAATEGVITRNLDTEHSGRNGTQTISGNGADNTSPNE